MNRCRFLNKLSIYLDNQLPEKDRLRLEEHLKSCKICALELGRLRSLSDKLHSWQAPVLDDGFDSSVRNKIVSWELERGQVKMKKKTIAILVPSGVLVAILMFLFVGTFFHSYLKKGYQGVMPAVTSYSVVPQSAAVEGKRLGYQSITASKQDVFGTSAYEPYYLESSFDYNQALSETSMRSIAMSLPGEGQVIGIQQQDFNTEAYDRIYDNDFKLVVNDALSTFSIDVDTASYSNVRRFLNMNQLPPKDAVRIEELINYFSYDYPQPQNNQPFSVTTEAAVCPWNKEHRLVLIGLQGKNVETKNLPKSNLVFLLDVSGSMDQPNKLPLVKSAFRLLVEQLRPEDNISIVVYAGASGVVLDSAQGNEKVKILQAIDNLKAGGSTAGASGIQLAYEIAKKNYLKDGNNRVILATDGDFNIGITNDGDLTRLIEDKRSDGIFLSVFGFGMGNYKDSKMEKLADKGNGTLAYIDNMLEAKKVFVNQLAGTLLTIAKDVKIQVEFNPAKVKAYRLIGYENRVLANQDFNDDKKDAGEIGAGHTVTALYEIVSSDSKEVFSGTDSLKYQTVKVSPSDELLTVKLRYKEPNEDVSKLLSVTLADKKIEEKISDNLNFASAVAEFGLILRDSQYKANSSYADVLARSRASKGPDNEGYRAEFIKLVELAQILDTKNK